MRVEGFMSSFFGAAVVGTCLLLTTSTRPTPADAAAPVIVRPAPVGEARVNHVETKSPTWLAAYQAVANVNPPRQAEVVLGGGTKQKIVALTFDDAPRPTTTHELLKVLATESAPATFFMIGKQVDRFPSVVSEVELNGFGIGNHSYSHIKLTDAPMKDELTEYLACNDAIHDIAPIKVQYCRPPGGDADLEVEQAAAAEGMKTVFWTDDPADYTEPGEQKILDYTLSHLSDGGIILLHDGVEQTVNCLPKMIEEIRARGYKIVPLSDLPVTKVPRLTPHPKG
jgi:peptidoglycan/xylan/chitin deacetylase (PgdA/CDA1 family)